MMKQSALRLYSPHKPEWDTCTNPCTAQGVELFFPELRKGLCTYPTLVCEDCKASTPIVSSYAGETHRHAVNLQSSLAKVAIGESHSSFATFCCLRGGGGGEDTKIVIYIYHFVPPYLF